MPLFPRTRFAVYFGGEAYLAVRLGDQELDALQRYAPLVGTVLAVCVVVCLVVKWLRKRREATV